MKNKNSVIFIFLFYMVILSPYISSWFPTLNGMPLGPIIRQLFFVLIFIIFIINIRKAIDVDVKKICHIYLFVCLLTFVSFLYGPSSPVQYAVGVASFIFYPAIFIFSLLLLNIVSKKNYLIFDKFFTNFFIVIGLFASLDVAMNGGLVEVFGYNPNYGGDDFSLITSYNGVTRANAGISDALAFGYLMAIAVIYFFNRSRRIYSVANYIGLFVCTMAGMLSLTRGAMISIFMTYIFYMFTFRRLLILLLIFPVIFYLIYVSPYAELFLGRFTDSDESSQASSLLRLVMALNSIEFLGSNPMGIGIGTQGAGNILSDTDNRLNTDNYFFHIFLELGLFFGLIFLYFLYSQFLYAFRRIYSVKFLLSYAFLFLVSGLLSSSIAFATLGVVYWFILYLMVLETRIFYAD